jgi:MoaA/NifB/PqqE/SkfB family radical SAM enzyme
VRGTHGWEQVSTERKQAIIDSIVNGTATSGPVHAELDLTDRCNVDCYFCNQMDVRSKQQVPISHAIRIIDELAAGGLRSVRLSGGGDPLFHREILEILDHLQHRNIIIDNLTTNGVALNLDVAERLVRGHAREVIFSLNAVDAPDYARMMQVKPTLFEKILANIRTLVATRGDSIYPSIVTQFLLDKENFTKVGDMYDLGRSLGADRVAISTVLEIPNDRIDHSILLSPEDAEIARPYIRDILERDRDTGLLQIGFAIHQWNAMLAEERAAINVPEKNQFGTAASFKEENGHCFFGWYTATVRGTGDMYPCCLLMNPTYKPLGNALEGSMQQQWNGPGFTRLREEQRDVLLTKGEMIHRPSRFTTIAPQCITPGACWLKNMYFRADDDFYRQLGEALDIARKREVRVVGTGAQMSRALEVMAFRRENIHLWYDKWRDRTRPLRHYLSDRFHLGFLRRKSA